MPSPPPERAHAVLLRRLAASLFVTLLGCAGPLAETPALAPVQERWVTAEAAPLTGPTEEPEPRVVLADGLDLDEATTLCLWLSPPLRLARLEAAVPRAGARHAGRWEDPEIAIEAHRVLDDVEEPWILGVSLAFSLPLSGSPAAATRTALARGEVASWQAYVAEWQAVGRLRRDWLAWSFRAERLALLVRVHAELDELVALAHKLADGGVIGAHELALFRIEQARRALEWAKLDAEQQVVRLELLSAIGLAAGFPGALVPRTDLGLPAVPAPDRARVLAEHHPEIQLALAQHRLAHAVDEAAWRKALPDLLAQPGYEREEATHRVGLELGARLPLWNANAQERAEAAASRRAASLAVLARYAELLGQAARYERAADTASTIATALERELVPLARAQLATLRERAEQGALDAVLLVQAVAQRYEVEAEWIEAKEALAQARADLSHLLDRGRPHLEGSR